MRDEKGEGGEGGRGRIQQGEQTIMVTVYFGERHLYNSLTDGLLGLVEVSDEV